MDTLVLAGRKMLRMMCGVALRDRITSSEYAEKVGVELGLEKGMTSKRDMEVTNSWTDHPPLAGKTARIQILFVCLRSGLKEITLIG